MKKGIVWFRNDLRLHDNEALYRAAEECSELILLYCVDPRSFGETAFGLKKTGYHRARFLFESLRSLDNNLKTVGGELVIRQGKPEELIPVLCKQYDIESVYFHEEVNREEVEVEEALEQKLPSGTLQAFWGSSLFHYDDLPFSIEKFPDVFTAFRKKVEKYSRVRELIPEVVRLKTVEGIESDDLPDMESLGITTVQPDVRSVLSFDGGEDAALERLNHYYWDSDKLKGYKRTRNGLLGADYSSKFSPWLANGSLSPRYIYHEVKKYEKERTKNDSTYWLIFELIWRDYFRFSAAHFGDRIFYAGGIQGKKRDWSHDEKQFEAWKQGKTGIPFVDANMRELNATGFMSNRGRQNVASFLAQNLNLDWRMGAEYFEEQLLDYDPCSNYGNWAYNATVGHDPRNRYFNIESQAERYDSKGEYVKTWLPELKDVPIEKLHQPYKMSDEQRAELGIHPDVYPKPIIDLEKSYETIRDRG
jgi:deoxyribodipyrimidine photo-lyase